ncbi:MAG: TRAP transporter TatT component family protein [Gammaproteobacteria bacterium]|nr:TRAP transporter TatT component family protein [Gammaproteobacteria bacterium]
MIHALPKLASRARALALLMLAIVISGCSTSQIVVRGAMPLMDGGLEAMNRETDLELASSAIPATLKMLEGMAVGDPGNSQLRIYLAQGFYGYSYSFVEQESPTRAVALYTRCLDHARAALNSQGFKADIEVATLEELDAALAKSSKRIVPALFWSASCMAKRTDLDRTSPSGIAQLARAARLMQRVLALDENYYYGGPHMFFGVYYGGRAPMFGGDYALSEQHFAQAREATTGKLLLVDVLHAEYLARQQMDRIAFHNRLTTVVEAADDLLPEMALANQVAKQRARYLLSKEAEWF